MVVESNVLDVLASNCSYFAALSLTIENLETGVIGYHFGVFYIMRCKRDVWFLFLWLWGTCSLKMYNSLVERCFNDCVDSFTRKSLQKQEETCVMRCAEKFMKHSMRVGMRFAELNQGAATPDQNWIKPQERLDLKEQNNLFVCHCRICLFLLFWGHYELIFQTGNKHGSDIGFMIVAFLCISFCYFCKTLQSLFLLQK